MEFLRMSMLLPMFHWLGTDMQFANGKFSEPFQEFNNKFLLLQQAGVCVHAKVGGET